MAVLKVRRYGDPVLRRRAREVEAVTPEIRRLVVDMTDKIYDEVGIGLAAPQVGASIRLMVVGDESNLGEQARVYPIIPAQGVPVTSEEDRVSPSGVRAARTR